MPDPARSTADRDFFYLACPTAAAGRDVLFNLFMTGLSLIYHPTADYSCGSQGLPRGFAEPRSLYGPAGSLGVAPEPE